MTTAFVEPIAATAMGAATYTVLPKPYTPKRLLSAIQAEFDKHPLSPEPERPEDVSAVEPATTRVRDAG